VTLEIRIEDKDLCFYDADIRDWELEPCGYEFRVGQSSADLPLAAEWRYEGAEWHSR
jgi:hypothetical protein